MIKKTSAVFALALLCACAPTTPLPQYVAGPFSGYVYDCESQKQVAPKAQAFVTVLDLDGDGKPDHLFDISRGCEANRLLYCNADGCNVKLFLSSQELDVGGVKATGFKIEKRKGGDRLTLNLKGEACGGAATCTKDWVWNGTTMELK